MKNCWGLEVVDEFCSRRSIGEMLSRKIAFSSFICACMVVIDHSDGKTVEGGLAWWIEEFVSNGLCQMAVPFFFVISGFFLAGHVGQGNWWRIEVAKRVKSLLVPMLLWSAVGIVISMYETSASIFTDWPLMRFATCVGMNPFRMPEVSSLWYLRALFMLVVISPPLVWCVQRFRWKAIIFWFALSLGLSVVMSKYPSFNNFVGNFLPLKWGCCWFSMGILLRGEYLDWLLRKKSTYYGIFMLVGIAIVLASKCLLLHADPIAALLQKISIPFCLVGFWGFVPALKLPGFLRGMSFPIYLIHPTIMHYCRLMGVCYCMRIVSAVMLSIMFAIVAKKSFPAVAKYSFGGR